MRISTAIADLLRKGVVPSILRAGKAAEYDAGVIRGIGNGAKAAARKANDADLEGASRIPVRKTSISGHSYSVDDFARSFSPRIAATYGDRLRILGRGPAVERHLCDLEHLPDNFNNMVKHFSSQMEGGIDIAEGPATAIMSELRGEIPRGYPIGASWDAVGGLYQRATHRVVLTSAKHGSISVALHECGHALDHALGDVSNSAEFGKLYNSLDTMKPYFSQKGEAGRQETFAEGLGAWVAYRSKPSGQASIAMADALGMNVNKQEQGDRLMGYFSELHHSLERTRFGKRRFIWR
ncbi:anthrax toxin lethal factor-related metalloendopeptidase [Nocardia jejuensis]|uniref:anthrax toxin lethal factor-related metalloendopeptidase n=1 Tax=Nocardia jejuensis TaxID=328049 RepID=UPI000B0E7141|nr:hypothetical protein [Nocardia jejuensis]